MRIAMTGRGTPSQFESEAVASGRAFVSRRGRVHTGSNHRLRSDRRAASEDRADEWTMNGVFGDGSLTLVPNAHFRAPLISNQWLRARASVPVAGRGGRGARIGSEAQRLKHAQECSLLRPPPSASAASMFSARLPASTTAKRAMADRPLRPVGAATPLGRPPMQGLPKRAEQGGGDPPVTPHGGYSRLLRLVPPLGHLKYRPHWTLWSPREEGDGVPRPGRIFVRRGCWSTRAAGRVRVRGTRRPGAGV